jgi:hypothetical protein
MGRGTIAFAGLTLLAASCAQQAKTQQTTEDVNAYIGRPGYSRADDVLKGDVLRLAKATMPAFVKRATGDESLLDCKQVELVDAMITRFDETTGKWSEDWTFQVCDTTATMPIQFEPDGQGGTFFNLTSTGLRVQGTAEQ